MKENKEKLKVAFIGGGINSAVGIAHYTAINMDNIFKLVAGFFSRHEDINKKTGEFYQIPNNRLYNSIEDLIAKEKDILDAVIILTPTDQHPNHVIRFLKHNIPVICEKSLTGSIQEAEDIKKTLMDHRGFLTVTYNYLGYPMVRELKSMISQGKLGKINHIQIEMPQEGFKRIGANDQPVVPQDWRLHDGIIPTISLDLGVHLHMFVKYLTNETPTDVIAISESFGNFTSIIDNVNAIIKYTNNLTCNMWYSKIAIGDRNGLKFRLYGEKGSAEWLQENPEILNLADSKGRRWKVDRGNAEVEISNQPRYTRFKVGHPAGFIEAFANYYQDIAFALEDYKKNGTVIYNECFGIEESYEGIQLLVAIQKSSLTNQWENI